MPQQMIVKRLPRRRRAVLKCLISTSLIMHCNNSFFNGKRQFRHLIHVYCSHSSAEFQIEYTVCAAAYFEFSIYWRGSRDCTVIIYSAHTTRTLDRYSLILSLMGTQWTYPRMDTGIFFILLIRRTSHFNLHSIMTTIPTLSQDA